jgi:hypothetical protein
MATKLIHRISLTPKQLEGSDYRRFEIKITLADECRNGHNDFSLTASGWSKDNFKQEMDCGGCMHEEILKLRPDLKPFADLHLSDAKGNPMYASANGFYHLTNSTKEVTKHYLRITNAEYKELRESEDEQHFCFLLEELGVPQRWGQEAKSTIQLLESMTGETFEDNSMRYQYTPMEPIKKSMYRARIRVGYYDQEEKERRAWEKTEAKVRNLTNQLTETADKAIQKIIDELFIKIHLLEIGVDLDNVIYYNHTNEVCFNWRDYGKKISKEEFDDIVKRADMTILPKGIKFTIK